MNLSKKEDIEKLILVVQKYPLMYDMTSTEYKDIRKKDYTWDNIISLEMNGVKGKYII